jgi:hypothetical protein
MVYTSCEERERKCLLRCLHETLSIFSIQIEYQYSGKNYHFSIHKYLLLAPKPKIEHSYPTKPSAFKPPQICPTLENKFLNTDDVVSR